MDELSEEEAPAYALGLNALQRRAVLAPLNRPLEVIAPPGSGKTAVLTRRIEHVLVNNVPPQNVLACRHSPKPQQTRCDAGSKRLSERASQNASTSLLSTPCRLLFADLILSSRARSVTLLFARPHSSSTWCARAIGEWKVAEAAAAGTKPQVAAEVDLLRELPRVHLPPQPTHPGCFRS